MVEARSVNVKNTTTQLSLCIALLMCAAHHLVKECAKKRRSRRGWRRSISASVFKGLLRHPVLLLTPKTVGAALVEVFAVILPVEATTPLVNAPPDIGSEHGVITLDVTAATTTTAAVMATSILWAFISSLARIRRIEEASPGDRGRFLLSPMVPIVTREIPGPKVPSKSLTRSTVRQLVLT